MAGFNQADYIQKIVAEKTIGKNARQKLTEIHIVRKDGKMIDPVDLMYLWNDIQPKLDAKFEGKNPEYLIRARGPRGHFTLKRYDEEDLDLSSVDDYLTDRVLDEKQAKLAMFYSVEIILKRSV